MYDSKKLNKIIACMVMYAFITLLNQTSINTAITTIRYDFNISTSTVQWLSTIYLLVSGIMVPVTAYLSTRFSIKKLFLVSLILFIIGMLVAGFAPNYETLVIARVVQALGGGIAAPLNQTVVFMLAPPNKRGSLMGVIGLVIGVAPAFGPSISGYLVSNFDWHSIFLVYVPILILNLILSIYYMPEINEGDKDERLDIPSVFLSTITFGSILFATSMIGDKGFTSPYVIVPLVVGVIFLIIFYKKQMAMEHPLLNFHVYDYSTFRLAIILLIMANIALLSVALLLPIYLQEIHGYSAWQAGLILLPGAFLSSFMSLVTGKIFDKYGAREITFIGFIVMAFATYNLAKLNLTTAVLWIVVVYTVRCIAISMVMMPPQTAGMNELPKNLIGHGSAMLNTIRTISGAVGTAVLVSVMTYVAKNYTPNMNDYQGRDNVEKLIKIDALAHGYSVAMLIVAAVAVLGVILALKLPKKDV